jgi:hypothetical protein
LKLNSVRKREEKRKANPIYLAYSRWLGTFAGIKGSAVKP